MSSLEWIARLVPRNCGTLVDLGCGSGELSERLTSVARRVIGVDIDRQGLINAGRPFATARRLYFVQADARLGPPCRDVQCIVAIFSMHHFLSGDCLTRIKGCLARDGTLIVLDMFANEKRSIARFLVDQFATSSGRHILSISRTAGALGIGPTLSPWVHKLRWTLSRGAKNHVRKDLSEGLPPTLNEWRHTLDSVFPGGEFRVLLGSSFLFTWPNTSVLPNKSANKAIDPRP
mgnify:CR=1 FL=1